MATSVFGLVTLESWALRSQPRRRYCDALSHLPGCESEIGKARCLSHRRWRATHSDFERQSPLDFARLVSYRPLASKSETTLRSIKGLMGHHITTSDWSRPRRRRLTQLPKHRGRPTFGQTLVAWNDPHRQNTRSVESQGHRPGAVDRRNTPSARDPS